MIQKILIWFLTLVYLMGQGGCATGPYGYPKPEPLLEQYRNQLGTIGVVKEAGVPVIQIDKPLHQTTGVLTGMGRGTVEGAENSWDWWVDLCSGEVWKKKHVEKRMVGVVIGQVALPVVAYVLVGVCYILTPPVALFGGIGGFFYGALPPDESVAYPAADEATLQYTVANYPIQENFQRAFVKVARFRTAHTFVVGSEEGSQTAEEMFDQGVDTILELSVQRIWLKRAKDREGDMNPLMVLSLVVQIRLIQATEKTLWYDHTFIHETKKRSYAYWREHVYNPYYGFREDLEKAYRNLAEEMVQKLFIHTPSTSPAKIDNSVFFTETTLIAQK